MSSSWFMSSMVSLSSLFFCSTSAFSLFSFTILSADITKYAMTRTTTIRRNSLNLLIFLFLTLKWVTSPFFADIFSPRCMKSYASSGSPKRASRHCYKYFLGSTALPFMCTSKWQCDPVDLPVLPALAMTCPWYTLSPTDTFRLELCPYRVENPPP